MDSAFDFIFNVQSDEEFVDNEIENEPDLMREEYDQFIKNNNILSEEVRATINAEKLFTDLELFTDPVTTTITVKGLIDNLRFQENELIHLIEPSIDIPILSCNYGKKKYNGYAIPQKIRISKKGRKPKPKVESTRKKQGTGTDFNSQLTFVVLSRNVRWALSDTDNIPYNSKVYKFKIFRNGRLQLPGVQQDNLADVVECARVIVNSLRSLYAGADLIFINPVMKNYKFMVNLAKYELLNLDALKNAIEREENENLFDTRYTRQDVKLSLIFKTPIYGASRKHTRINIFMRGKVNILGGFMCETTSEICLFIHKVIMQNRDSIIKQRALTLHESNTKKMEEIRELISRINYK